MAVPELTIREDAAGLLIEQGAVGGMIGKATVLTVGVVMPAILVPTLATVLPFEMAAVALTVFVGGFVGFGALFFRVLFGRFSILVAPGALRVTTGPLPTRTVSFDPSTIRRLRLGESTRVQVFHQVTARVPIEVVDAEGRARPLIRCYGRARARQLAEELARRLGEPGAPLAISDRS